jgi:hypothetical protein
MAKNAKNRPDRPDKCEPLRTVRLSAELLMEMFQEGKETHFRVEKGLLADVEI